MSDIFNIRQLNVSMSLYLIVFIYEQHWFGLNTKDKKMNLLLNYTKIFIPNRKSIHIYNPITIVCANRNDTILV